MMSEAKINPEYDGAESTWRRVTELADLVEVFDPAVQVCTWQREMDPAIGTYLSQLNQTRESQQIETLSPASHPELGGLPHGPGRESLIDDLAFLRELMNELLQCSQIGLRFARVRRAMCPGWHFDRTSVRLVCTYQGPGTQWLEDQGIERSALADDRIRDSAAVQAAAGEIVLLKGALWQDNEQLGAVHRSPMTNPDNGLRTLVTLDPLWRA